MSDSNIRESIVNLQTIIKFDPEYRWQTAECERLEPTEMRTAHLFWVVRMIWNNTAPAKHQIHPFRKYNFDSFYTPEYFRESVGQMLLELSKRTDLEERLYQQLEFMYKTLIEETDGHIFIFSVLKGLSKAPQISCDGHEHCEDEAQPDTQGVTGGAEEYV